MSASNEVEIVVTGRDESAPAFEGADKASRRYGEGLEAAGEKADKAEQRIMGARDAIDGAAAIMKGPGEQGLSAYLQGWADLASGFANMILPSLASLSMANIKSTASTVASTVAQKTAAAASKAWAAAQWVLNAAMSANPIGLVIVAVVALVAAIIIAYKKSETFREIVQAVGRAAVRAFGWVLDKVQDLIGWIRSNWPKLLAILTGPIGLAVRWIVNKWGDIVDEARALPGRIGRGIASLFRILTTPHRLAVAFIADKVDDVVGFFRRLSGRIRSGVSGVYNAFTRPFRDAIQAVQSWLQGLLDRIQGVGSSLYSNTVGRIPGFAHGGIVGAMGGGPRSGLVMVGEHGRELIQVAPGSRVHSNADTERMLAGGGGGGGPVVVHLQLLDRVVGSIFIDPLRKEIRSQGGDVQAVLGS